MHLSLFAVNEIADNMRFEAEALKEAGIDLRRFPYFKEALQRMALVASTRQALYGALDGEYMVEPDQTLELVLNMIGDEFGEQTRASMKRLGFHVLRSGIVRKCTAVSSLGVGALATFRVIDVETACAAFLILMVSMFHMESVSAGRISGLPKVERIMAWFYLQLQECVESEGTQGFLSLPDNFSGLVEEIEDIFVRVERGEERINPYFRDFERLDGEDVVRAWSSEQALEKFLARNIPVVEPEVIEAETD